METASEDDYLEEISSLLNQIDELQDKLYNAEEKWDKFEREKDELQELYDDVIEDNLLAAKLLIQLWTSLNVQTEFDKDIQELVEGYPQLLPKYYTPYFIKEKV